jgi:hypothetical protein
MILSGSGLHCQVANVEFFIYLSCEYLDILFSLLWYFMIDCMRVVGNLCFIISGVLSFVTHCECSNFLLEQNAMV